MVKNNTLYAIFAVIGIFLMVATFPAIQNDLSAIGSPSFLAGLVLVGAAMALNK